MKVRNKKRLKITLFMQKFTFGPPTYTFVCPLCEHNWSGAEGWILNEVDDHLTRHHRVDRRLIKLKLKEA